MNPTHEQDEITTLVRTTSANIMVNALAGTGKTTILEMTEAAAPTKPILCLAFNKRVADEAAARMSSTTSVRTFNSLGHRIWAAHIGKPFGPDTKKISNLVAELANTSKRGEASMIWENFSLIVEGVNKARALGYIPPKHAYGERSLADWVEVEEIMEEKPSFPVCELITNVLNRSIADAFRGSCDFNDQVYMPALFGGEFPKFPLTLVDEYQDLNRVNNMMVGKLVGSRRLIGVGDPNQSIYGFRGAERNGMGKAVDYFEAVEKTLSISFRCPENIVRAVRWHVPNFRWSKPGGSVNTLANVHLSAIPDAATILCRNNAPLLALAMRMLIGGRSVTVSGSDIGPKVIAQMRKLGPESLSQSALLIKIADWEADRLARENKHASDTAECMRVFARQASDLAGALAYATQLFNQKGRIQLLTGHKAKGLEFPYVIHLDPFLVGDRPQERNLSYVITTRSSDALYLLDSAEIKD